MPLRIFTMPISQPARAVSWACLYEGTKVEEVQIMPHKDTRTEEYRKINPIPHVPRLDEDGFVLNESHAIMAYLGDKFNWKLYPKDPKIRARIHQYMHWHHQNTRRVTLALFMPLMLPKMRPPKEVGAAYKRDFLIAFQAIEQWLSESKWLCADVPTVADLSAYCEIGQCLDKYTGLFSLNGISLDKYPKMTAWLAACEELEGYAQSHAALKAMGPSIGQRAAKALAAEGAKL